MKVSVIIPCRNEEQYIEKCVHSVLNNNYPHEDLSILVVDGLSTDGTPKLVKKLSEEYNNVELLVNDQQTTPFALNMGIEHSDSDVHIILGAHAEIANDYIRKCVEAIKSDEAIACVGGLLESVPMNENAQVIADAMSSRLGVGNATFRTGGEKAYVDTVAFGAYKKEVFKKCGLFNTALTRNQDDEFNYRVAKAGYKILFDPDIKAKYYVRSSFEQLAKQYFQYGYWKVFVNKLHKSFTSLRQLVPAAFVSYLFLGVLFSIAFRSLTKYYLLGNAIYLIAIATNSIRVQGLNGKAFKMMLAYIYLHYFYGIGYLEGVIDFILLQKKEVVRGAELTR